MFRKLFESLEQFMIETFLINLTQFEISCAQFGFVTTKSPFGRPKKFNKFRFFALEISPSENQQSHLHQASQKQKKNKSLQF